MTIDHWYFTDSFFHVFLIPLMEWKWLEFLRSLLFFFIERCKKMLLMVSNRNSSYFPIIDSCNPGISRNEEEKRADRRGLSASPLIDAVSRRATSLNESVSRKQYVSSSYPRERPSLPRISMDQFSWILSAARRAGHVSTMHVRVRSSVENRFPRGQTRYQTTFERIEPSNRGFRLNYAGN